MGCAVDDCSRAGPSLRRKGESMGPAGRNHGVLLDDARCAGSVAGSSIDLKASRVSEFRANIRMTNTLASSEIRSGNRAEVGVSTGWQWPTASDRLITRVLLVLGVVLRLRQYLFNRS